MIYVISDLHGCSLKKVQGLFQKAGFVGADYCFVLGDVIDRGPEGIAILQWMMYQPNMQLLLGNHEAMLLSCGFLFEEITEASLKSLDAEQIECFEQWMESGGKPTLDALRKLDAEEREDLLDYLREAPLYEAVEVGQRVYILTHSGIEGFDPSKKLKDYAPDAFLWNRPLLEDRYYEEAITVFGHTPTHYVDPGKKGEILVTDSWIDIDTGASCGLPPTLLRLDDMKCFR